MIFYYRYYFEIKNRMTLVLSNWFFTLTTCYFYKEILLLSFIEPNDNFLMGGPEPYFIFTNVSEIFSVYLQLIFFISNQITLIFFFYHTTLFLSTGLYKEEFEILSNLFKTLLVTWIIAFFLLNNFILPTSVDFFLSFQKTAGTLFLFEAKLIEYLNYVSNLYLICLVSCQLLMVMILSIFLLSNDLVKIQKLRKLFYLTFFIFATVVSPPDLISQVVLATGLISVYELISFITMINEATN